MCVPHLSKKSYIIVKNGLSRTPAPTIWLFFVNAFVGDGVLDVPKLVFRQSEGAHCAPLHIFTPKAAGGRGRPPLLNYRAELNTVESRFYCVGEYIKLRHKRGRLFYYVVLLHGHEIIILAVEKFTDISCRTKQ